MDSSQLRIAFDSLNLYAVLHECQLLVGGKIRHIGQPRPLEIVLSVYAQRAEHRLLISADAQFARCSLCTIRPSNPPTPPAFCMTLRKYLQGGIVRAIQQVGFDRIARLEVESPDGELYHLIAEIMGKHSNLILTTAGGLILGAIKRVPPSRSRLRSILPHHPYTLPPTRREGRLHPLTVSREEIETLLGQIFSQPPNPGSPPSLMGETPKPLTAWLMERFEGLSPFTAAEIASRIEQGGVEGFLAWQRAVLEGRWEPVLIRSEKGVSLGAYPFRALQVPAGWQHPRASISLAWEHHFQEALLRHQAENQRATLLAQLRRALWARQEAIQSLQEALHQAAQASQWQLYGELILAFGQQLPPGTSELEAPDYTRPDSPLIRIPLDPESTPVENAETYFAKARRARAAQSGLEVRKNRLEQEIAQIGCLLDRLEQSEDRPEALQAVWDEASRQGWLRQPALPLSSRRTEKDPFEGHKIRVYTSEEGYQVLLGENAEANDFLTLRFARPHDWWLHVRAGTSAHVVIRTNNHPERVPRRTLEFAARLAAQHSTDRHSGVIPVDYTLCKYVRKPRGAPAGTVLYTHEKTLYITRDR